MAVGAGVAAPDQAGPRVVVLRALGLGDLLTAVPALRGLRRRFPDHRLVLGAPGGLAPLALRTDAVDVVVDVPFGAGIDPVAGVVEGALPRSLRGAEVAVNLHGRGPQSHRLLAATSPERLLGFACDDVPEAEGPAWDSDEHEVARWCRLVGPDADPSDLDVAAVPERAPQAATGATLLHPGAASAARRWPVERWVALARAERDAGRRVALTGGPSEVRLAEAVAEAAELPAEAVLAGRTGLLDLVAAVAAADALVCGDTGVAHVATAVGTPSVVLFGPTPPALWGPPPDRPQHRVLWAGRTGDPHADAADPGLLEITLDDVAGALADLRAGG